MKIFFGVLVLLFTGVTVSAKHTQITKENQGPDGFKYVHEFHDQASNTLSCKEPGTNLCAWLKHSGSSYTIIGNGTDYLVDDLVAYAEGQMDQGLNSGTTVFPGQVLVTWETTELGYVITILNGTDFPEHLK